MRLTNYLRSVVPWSTGQGNCAMTVKVSLMIGYRRICAKASSGPNWTYDTGLVLLGFVPVTIFGVAMLLL